MVRAERKGILFDDFIDRGLVAIGWGEAGDFTSNPDPASILEAVQETYPDKSEGTNRIGASQIARFLTEPQIGDGVITYSPDRRVYAVGRFTGPAQFDATAITRGDLYWPYIRTVDWTGELSRDDLSQKARYSLNALLTLFKLRPFIETEITALLAGVPLPVSPQTPTDDTSADTDDDSSPEDIELQSLELIKDMIARLSPEMMEHFVAGLLRAMGYQTRVSPIGPDRGQDILATPDALGLEDPRIVVEVKHRKGAIGAPALRSFLGGRHPSDKGLYVSTGGFTKDAQYEADRASIPLRLMTLNDLVEHLVTHYEKLDLETRDMIPLKRIYWPLK
ncbi:restriction endonuclease [Rhodalgimonas zhirmunskyi]|nr:restriction endonuclease [Rhodoalgimonas zhirmunskyi]